MPNNSNLNSNSVGWTPASVLMNATADAMENIFDIRVFWPWDNSNEGDGVNTSEAAVSYRATGFDIPEAKSETYDVSWYGVTVKKVGATIKLDRTFKITFRLDANYALYQKFVAWKKLFTDANSSGVSNVASALGSVRVIAPAAEYNALSWKTPENGNGADNQLMLSNSLGSASLIKWEFEDVAAINVSTPKFKNSGKGNKMEYTVDFIFGDMHDPFYAAVTAIAHNHRQSS